MGIVLDPKVWGPHYWHFLHTISMNYPEHPNAVTKKKYYEFVQNIPMFIPLESMASHFEKLLDEYPVTPYLDNRESFIRWMWFIHNKINQKLEVNEITLQEFYANYYEQYKPKEWKNMEYKKIQQKVVYAGVVLAVCGGIYYLYDK